MPEPTLVRDCRIDPDTGPGPTPQAVSVAHRLRLAALVAEARHLAHRRALVEAASERSRRRRGRCCTYSAGGRAIGHRPRKAARLGIVFHRLLDQLHAGGLHDEALAIFRAYRSDLAGLLERQHRPGASERDPAPGWPPSRRSAR